MNASQNESAPIAAATSRKTRLAVYAVSGALAGLLLGLPAVILVRVLDGYQGMSWRDFFDSSPLLDANFWRFVMWREGLSGGAFYGLIAGTITSLFANRLSHPIACASLWAFILATPTLALQPFLHDHLRHPMEFALPIAISLVFGGAYGLLLGVLARWLGRLPR